MAIEQFTTDEFQAALPVGAWKALGMIQGEQCYLVTPSDAPAGYAVLVRSSIGQAGIADDCGEDSIRCILCKVNGEKITPIGNKAKRWITRVKGWQGRMMETLRHCKAQLARIRPCPHCSAMVVPFTSHKKESKGRAFVSCMNKPDCGKFFEWCDEPMKQVETPTAKTPTGKSPTCPACKRGVLLLSKFKAGELYCSEYKQGCKHKEQAPDAAPALTPTENHLRRLLSEAAALVGNLPDKEKSVAALVDLERDKAANLADFLISIGNEQALRASH